MQLQSVLEPESWLDWVLLVNDMIIQPVILYVFLVFGEFPKMFTLLSAGYRFIETWKKWIRYQVLRGHAREWVFVAKLFGGPFISCNDPKYHVYVYADAMERLRLGMYDQKRHRVLNNLRKARDAKTHGMGRGGREY